MKKWIARIIIVILILFVVENTITFLLISWWVICTLICFGLFIWVLFWAIDNC